MFPHRSFLRSCCPCCFCLFVSRVSSHLRCSYVASTLRSLALMLLPRCLFLCFFYLRALQLQKLTPEGAYSIFVALMLPRRCLVLCFCLRDVHLRNRRPEGRKWTPVGSKIGPREAPEPWHGSHPGRLLGRPRGPPKVLKNNWAAEVQKKLWERFSSRTVSGRISARYPAGIRPA